MEGCLPLPMLIVTGKLHLVGYIETRDLPPFRHSI